MPLPSSGRTKSASASRRPQSGSARRPRSSPSRGSSRSIVIGLDISLTGFGLVVWDGQRVLRRRRYETKPLSHRSRWEGPLRLKGTDEQRIEWLRRKVGQAVSKYAPALVVIEDHAFSMRSRGLSTLHELHGVIKNDLHRKGVLFVKPKPNEIKLLFAGKGNASKSEMQDVAEQVCGVRISEDESDALGCAWYGWANLDSLLRQRDTLVE